LIATRTDAETTLRSTIATNGKVGYVLSSDLDAGGITSPSEAATYLPEIRSLIVYDGDGTNVVGEFLTR
jgi:hypothetical protein